MVTLKKTFLYMLFDSISLAFDGDTELLSKYHVLSGGETAITSSFVADHTFKTIIEAEKEFDLNYYIVYDNDVRIGFVVLCETPGEKFIYSFGININFRNAENLKYFFSNILVKMEETFRAYLWEKNTRAISYLEKCGMEQYERRDDIVVLIFNF